MMKFIQNTGLFLFVAALLLFILLNGLQSFRLSSETLPIENEYHRAAILESARNKQSLDQTWTSSFAFSAAFGEILQEAKGSLDLQAQSGLPTGVQEWDFRLGDWKKKEYTLAAAKSASVGPVSRNPWLFFGLTIGLGVLGGLLYILPLFREIPGIKNNGVYHSSMTRGITGWLGILTGVFLITFYVLLYWYPQHITAWMIMSDPLSRLISGHGASQWFVYGLLYTVVMLTMGVRMISKYRHNRYQMIRTGSVMFFQTSFAFLIPEILVRLNQPYYDFKNIWPLNYSFFFDWNLNNLLQSGGLGLFMLVWGIALIVVAVPVLTYFFGKRWYCSWVCGCGGLAETLGDPYRQLSDKSLRAWKIERWMVHGVLVFAIVMTAMTLYTYFSGQAQIGFLNSDSVRSWYGFLIGSAFAGVVGTGFYPLMGNRVWCRFGCPLAAYLGIVQRFKSRFRITVNGGQCISCGNCSTYCEMGIDVRHYAQRGQDVVRASCVGCGICAAVCPRGVLKLENTGAKRNV
jgi:ferredoxin-type protein NapH